MTSVLRMTATVVMVIVLGWGCSTGAQPAGEVTALAQAQPQKEQQEEFIPIDQLPPQEQLPAAPLLVGAYAFVLVMLFGYLIAVSRRLTAIQRDVERLDSDLKRAGRT